jgi:hypothetical protein
MQQWLPLIQVAGNVLALTAGLVNLVTAIINLKAKKYQ